MKWKTWSIAVLSVALLMLSACSNSGNGTADTGNGKETVELRFAWWGSEDRHTATLEAIKIFEEKIRVLKSSQNIRVLTDTSPSYRLRSQATALPICSNRPEISTTGLASTPFCLWTIHWTRQV